MNPTAAPKTELHDRIADGRTWLSLAQGDFNQKSAAEGIHGEALRTQSVEQGILRRAVTPTKETINAQALQEDSVMPSYLREVCPGSVGAVVQTSSGSTPGMIMGLRRYRIKCYRNAATDVSGDVDVLAGYQEDCRKLFQEWQLRDMLFQEDEGGLALIYGCTGDMNTTWDSTNYRFAMTGARGCVGLGATLTRGALAHLEKGLLSTNAVLEAATYITNVVTFRDFLSFSRDEAGGDWSEQMLMKGIGSVTDPLGKNWVTTIKRGLVPDGYIIALAAKEFLGDFIEVQETKVEVEHKKWWVTASAWNMTGFALGNSAAVALGVVGETLTSWTDASGS